MELVDDRFLFSALRELAISEGLDDIGIASVDPLMDARRDLKDRKQRGLHGGMHFTYGNPERATSPADLLEGAKSIVVALRRYDAPLSSARPGLASIAHYVARDEYGQLRSGLQAIASYLHARITKSWQGRKPAIIASFGFVIVWICYLGVNFLGKGLHTYGQIL